jgi:hypothetical protein
MSELSRPDYCGGYRASGKSVASPSSGRQRVCFVSVLPGWIQVPQLFIPVLGINASGEIRMTETTPSITKRLPNHAVEATAPRRCSFDRSVFYSSLFQAERRLRALCLTLVVSLK